MADRKKEKIHLLKCNVMKTNEYFSIYFRLFGKALSIFIRWDVHHKYSWRMKLILALHICGSSSNPSGQSGCRSHIFPNAIHVCWEDRHRNGVSGEHGFAGKRKEVQYCVIFHPKNKNCSLIDHRLQNYIFSHDFFLLSQNQLQMKISTSLL